MLNFRGTFSVHVDEKDFEAFKLRYIGSSISVSRLAELYIAQVLVGSYRGSNPDGCDIIVEHISGM